MAHVVKNNLYQILSTYGVPQFVEAETEEDLFEYVVDDWLLKGMEISYIFRMDYDNSKRQIPLTCESFKRILKDRLNKPKGKMEISAKDQELLRKTYCC